MDIFGKKTSGELVKILVQESLVFSATFFDLSQVLTGYEGQAALETGWDERGKLEQMYVKSLHSVKLFFTT